MTPLNEHSGVRQVTDAVEEITSRGSYPNENSTSVLVARLESGRVKAWTTSHDHDFPDGKSLPDQGASIIQMEEVEDCGPDGGGRYEYVLRWALPGRTPLADLAEMMRLAERGLLPNPVEFPKDWLTREYDPDKVPRNPVGMIAFRG